MSNGMTYFRRGQLQQHINCLIKIIARDNLVIGISRGHAYRD